jgi:hypothetical protein
VSVVGISPGGPFAGPTNRVVDLTSFAAEATTSALGSTAHAAAAFHGNEGAIPAARGLGPSKADSALAPTPIGGLPVQPPETLPLEAVSAYPASPDDSAQVAAANAHATTGVGRASSSVSSNGAAGAVRTAAAVAVDADGALLATASSVVEGAAFGPVRIARVASSATTRQALGGEVRSSETLDVAGLEVGGVAVRVDRDSDVTIQGVRVRTIGADRDDTGTTAPVLEISLTLPATLTGSGVTQAVYRFGGVSTHASGESESDSVLDDVDRDVTTFEDVTTFDPTEYVVSVLPDYAANEAPLDEERASAPRAAVARDDASVNRWVRLGAVAGAVALVGLAVAGAQRRRRAAE